MSKIGELGEVQTLYLPKGGYVSAVTGRMGANVHTRKTGETYQLFQGTIGNIPTTTSDKLKTWEELSRRQKESFLRSKCEMEIEDIRFDIAKGALDKSCQDRLEKEIIKAYEEKMAKQEF